MKVSILYVSQTGNTDTAADYIVDGILANYPFIQVKPMNIHRNELDLDFVRQSDAVIFGSPVYLAGMSWELKRWFDQTVRLDLSGKLGAAFVTANDPAGGTDTAVMDILRNMILKGMLVFSGTGRRVPINSRQVLWVLHPGWTTMRIALKPLVPVSQKWPFGCLVSKEVFYGEETPIQL